MKKKYTPSAKAVSARASLTSISRSIQAGIKSGLIQCTVNEAIEEIYRKQTGQNDWKTFKGWKEKGFKVEKGSSGFPIWGKPKRLKNDTTKVSESLDSQNTELTEGAEEAGGHRWFPLAYIYHAAQVLNEAGDRPTGYIPSRKELAA